MKELVTITKNSYKGCYDVNVGVWAHEPRILDTYIIGAYTIETIYDYNIYMLRIPVL